MKIDLDKFELGYLLDACARGSHLRQGIWRRCVDEWWAGMTRETREHIFHYTIRDNWECMSGELFGKKISPNCGFDDFRTFCERFDPSNLYEVSYDDGNGQKGSIEAFRCHDGHYHIGHNQFIADEYITNVEWIGGADARHYLDHYGHLYESEVEPHYKLQYLNEL